MANKLCRINMQMPNKYFSDCLTSRQRPQAVQDGCVNVPASLNLNTSDTSQILLSLLRKTEEVKISPQLRLAANLLCSVSAYLHSKLLEARLCSQSDLVVTRNLEFRLFMSIVFFFLLHI